MYFDYNGHSDRVRSLAKSFQKGGLVKSTAYIKNLHLNATWLMILLLYGMTQ